jgi:hypothetical protein
MDAFLKAYCSKFAFKTVSFNIMNDFNFLFVRAGLSFDI